MNARPLLLALILLFGCTPTDEATEMTPAAADVPIEWVTYEGQGGPGTGRHVVLVSGDEEYRSEEMLPQLARILSARHGFTTTVLFAQDPAYPGVIDPNYTQHIPGLAALGEADMMVLFTRFRALPDDQMAHIEAFLQAGKPLVAIRTATHAFEYGEAESPYRAWSNSFRDEASPWHDGFGRLVLGERWHTHHGHHKHQSTRGRLAPGAAIHPITRGITDGAIWGPTDVYGVRLPMPEGVTPLVLGEVVDRAGDYDEADPFFGMRPTDTAVATTNPGARQPYNPNDPMMPIAWTKPYQLPEGQAGLAFTSTIGASTDFANPGLRRLLVNAVYHLLDMEVSEAADVTLVGTYAPSPYSFHTDDYWAEQDLRVADHAE